MLCTCEGSDNYGASVNYTLGADERFFGTSPWSHGREERGQMYSVEHYINAREEGLLLQEVMDEFHISEATAYCYEIGYQCYLKKTNLDVALTLLTSN